VKHYCTARPATGDNMAHAHFTPGTKGYRRTLRKCKTYCLSTTKIVARTRLSVTLYLHWLSCYLCINLL